MTATDDLRRLLDERGVEWADQFGPFPVTAYKTHYVVWIAKEYTDGLLSIETRPVTPEQAIAATLGSDRESELQSALNKAAGNWAHADGLLRGLLEECEECPDTGCMQYIEKVVKPNMRKVDA